MSLCVYHSNRLESLSGVLAELIKKNPPDPFTAERIVIPHRTMAQWLRLEIASKLGIAANLDFEQPAAFAWSILRGVVPSLPKSQGFTPDTLRWHLFELLPEFGKGGDAAEVRRYLADGDEVKRFELADKLAGVYDRCLNFRPDWIRDWEQGATPHWQARLWRMLAGKVNEKHWVNALDAFSEQSAPRVQPEDWPERAFIFGVSSFSPSYMQLLEKLGEIIELHMLMLNPSKEYWREIRTRRRMRVSKSHSKTDERSVEDLHFEVGNELLAAWGRWGQNTFGELAEVSLSEEFFPDVGENSRLATVQADIQALRSAVEASAADIKAMRLPPPDASLQIHCCHSPMREAEVLHDRLLDLLETHPHIEPADILILTPDLARYGPAVAAVFEAKGRIPVTLSRYRAADSAVARAFLDLLSLPVSSYGIDAVLAPLESSGFRARFGIEEASLGAIREWACQAGIRRGIEAGGAGRDPAPVADHTWREGLRRLLMGYAAGDCDELMLDIAPATIPGVAGFEADETDFETLGRFIAYCDLAFELRSRVAAPRAVSDWIRFLHDVATQFFDDGSELAAYADFDAARLVAKEMEELRGLLDKFQQQLESTKCHISFDVILTALRNAAGSAALGPARLADGATIGSLRSGQILPAEIVCVLGMNNDSFPRNPHRHAFDLVEMDERRPGDRDERQEDRFAFLEALLAARTAFLATYTGREQRDDAEIPPSVVLEELIDYLVARYPDASACDTKQNSDLKARERQRVEHPLQPFSPRYFASDANDQLFSYSASMLEAARIFRDGAKPEWRWGTKLPEPTSREVSLRELEQFFTDPAKVFLRERLGIRLSDEQDDRDDFEPLEINNLEKYQLRDKLISKEGLGEVGKPNYERLRPHALASGALPHGGFGEIVFDDAEAELEFFISQLDDENLAVARDADPTHIQFEVAGFQVAGYVPNIAQDEQGLPYMLWWRNGKKRTTDLIVIHLRQLAWRAAGNPPLKVYAVWLDKSEPIPPPGDASKDTSHAGSGERIARWLEARWRGLSAPLPFFPQVSLDFVRKMTSKADAASETHLGTAVAGGKLFPLAADTGNTLEKHLASTRKSWKGESEKPQNRHMRMLWDPATGAEPISKDFQRLAESLLLPLVRK